MTHTRRRAIGWLLSAAIGACTESTAWVSYKDALGFSVQIPRGWKVASDGRSGRVVVDGTQGERALIWPVFVPGSLDASSARAVLGKMAAAAGVNAEWGRMEGAGPAAIRCFGRSGDRQLSSILTWVNSPKGSAAYVYVLSGPANIYRNSEATFAGILQSFRITGAAGGSEEPVLSYVRWQDPREGAFSLDTPSQWRMDGGLFRFAPVDVRSGWQTTSPDGKIRITGGDPELPTFTEPNQMLMMGGFREGSWYSPGYGVQMQVRRYLPGTIFSREYVTTKVARGCADLRITDNRDRPDAVSAINAVYARYGGMGVSVRVSAGETAFTCRQNGRLVSGYYFAGTQRTQMAGGMGGLWNAEFLFGYLASEGRAPLAQSALRHMLASVQINPQWAAMQQNITANTSQIVSRTQAEVSKVISDTYWSRQGVMDEISRRRSNAILGVVDAVDPATGREFKVENSSNYYWIDQRGTIVGTQTDTRPNLDFRELTRLP